MNIKFYGVIEGEMKENYLALPGTMVQTPNGEIPIEELKENDIIFNHNHDEIKINAI